MRNKEGGYMATFIKNNKTGILHLQLGIHDVYCGSKCQERVKTPIGLMYQDFPNNLYSIVEKTMTYDEFKQDGTICSRCKKAIAKPQNWECIERVFCK